MTCSIIDNDPKQPIGLCLQLTKKANVILGNTDKVGRTKKSLEQEISTFSFTYQDGFYLLFRKWSSFRLHRSLPSCTDI